MPLNLANHREAMDGASVAGSDDGTRVDNLWDLARGVVFLARALPRFFFAHAVYLLFWGILEA